ncbi:MAG: hypothetical protein VW443_04845 [Pseudomonadales bacterium]|jgi:hypothetical protein
MSRNIYIVQPNSPATEPFYVVYAHDEQTCLDLIVEAEMGEDGGYEPDMIDYLMSEVGQAQYMIVGQTDQLPQAFVMTRQGYLPETSYMG